ncbi:OmpA family protein [Biformimicrobium ophioploci]|uniref:OmpA-like domain-containing protein n=1 Tax=Biformimicrobium ophioploci TaxID=3036711 RepID=A0ABQ6M2T3_9GAMM|nr:OmpA family protein [Microbulbifer sp. NKW57]GMG88594.1 hypothetical protein MNKW57_29150 [Microbulbifer sp. NKW57]
MKKMLMAVTLTTAVAATGTSHASDSVLSTDAKQAAVFSGMTLAGAIAGGPLGMIAGALGGAWMGDKVEQAHEADMLAEQLAANREELGLLAQQLDAAKLAAGAANEAVIDALHVQMLFATGDDELESGQLRQLATLAEFLGRHPELEIRLDGHADPRGTDEYNNVLADQRALSVQRVLTEFGIDASRIQRHSHGADASTSSKGDVDGYAFERRVDIRIAPADSIAGIL